MISDFKPMGMMAKAHTKDEQIAMLEARIAELEAENIRISMHLDRERNDVIHYCKVISELESPKNCDGCKYESLYPTQLPCNVCIRQGTDRYEKEKNNG